MAGAYVGAEAGSDGAHLGVVRVSRQRALRQLHRQKQVIGRGAFLVYIWKPAVVQPLHHVQLPQPGPVVAIEQAGRAALVQLEQIADSSWRGGSAKRRTW